jgi:hypothetical protein
LDKGFGQGRVIERAMGRNWIARSAPGELF